VNRVPVAKLEDLTPRCGRFARIGEMGADTEIALFRLTDGRVKAVENRCPHKGGKLSEGMVCGSVVHCPLHDWRIDLEDGRVLEPEGGSVKVYETEIDPDGGTVYVKL